MIFFRYTRFLEGQVAHLQTRVEALEARNQELVLTLAPKLSTFIHEVEKTPPKHDIKKGETRATCSCGWIFNSDDPGVLQNAISSHYRDGTIQRGRKSWPQAKAALEAAGGENK
jgi:hypothetical protein